MFIAPFTNFEITAVTAGRQHSSCLHKRQSVRRFKGPDPLTRKALVNHPTYSVISCRSHHRIYFRQFLKNLIPVFFCQTTGYDQKTTDTIFFQFGHL